jgi:hypothetical protein
MLDTCLGEAAFMEKVAISGNSSGVVYFERVFEDFSSSGLLVSRSAGRSKMWFHFGLNAVSTRYGTGDLALIEQVGKEQHIYEGRLLKRSPGRAPMSRLA